MKKLFFMFLIIALSATAHFNAFASEEIKLVIDDKLVEVDTPPTIVGERTLVPVRAILEGLGATIDWDEDSQTVTGKIPGKLINITINSKTAKVNTRQVELDTPAMIINGRTMVPVRFIAESLGANVDWVQESRTVKINTNKKHITKDKRFEITTNLNWDIDKELNNEDGRNLGISTNKKLFISIVSENKEDFVESLDLEQYAADIKKFRYDTLDNVSITPLPDLLINNCKAKQFEMTYDYKSLKIKALGTIIETENHFHHLVLWGLVSDYNWDKAQAVKIINSFKDKNASITSVDTTKKTSERVLLSASEIGKQSNKIVYIEITDNKGFVYTGSGFIISKDGKIATNYHIIDKAEKISITLGSGKVYNDCKIIDYSNSKDIAILKIDANNLPYCTLGNSSDLVLGEEVIAIGNPKGLKNTLSTGNVSAIREDSIQISAPISGGSSGGALFNKYGEVVGITYQYISSGQNLGFAIPINEIKNLKMDKNLTLLELYKKVYGKDLVRVKIPYDEYSQYLNNNYYYLDVADGIYPLYFSYTYLFEDSKQLTLIYCVDKKNKVVLDDALEAGYSKEISDNFLLVMDKIKKYYGTVNLTGYIMYYGGSEDIDVDFSNNQIKEYCGLKYSEDTRQWYREYPYLRIISDGTNDKITWDKEHKEKK